MDNTDIHTNKESCIKACCTVICLTARKDYVSNAPFSNISLQEEMLEKQDKIINNNLNTD
jgi:hypothetical protein